MRKSTGQAISTCWDKEERDRLLLERLPLVRYLARRIHVRLPAHVPLEDMVNTGVLGLIDALNKFDLSKQVEFGSYAKFRIRGAIFDSLRKMDWAPRELRRKGRLVEEAKRKLSLDLSRAPTEIEVAVKLNLQLPIFRKLQCELDRLVVVSAHLPPGDEKEEDLCECLPDQSEDTPLFNCMRSESAARLAGAFATLDERQQHVLALYYREELTMKKVGGLLGIGESRVSQIHASALRRLRKCLDGSTGTGVGAAGRQARKDMGLKHYAGCSEVENKPAASGTHVMNSK